MREPAPHLPSTQAAVTALREIAEAHGLETAVTDDIGADRTSRRTAAPAFTATDPDGTLPHEAHIEITGPPAITVRLFPEGDALITVEGVEFPDVPRDSTPAFLEAVLDGRARVTGRFLPPGQWLTVPLPDGETHREPVPLPVLTPWLARAARPRP